MDDDRLDRLLRALGDTTRRRLLDRLRDTPGLTQAALGDGFAQSRQAISKHLAVLADADLVASLWRGREKLHYLNPLPLQALPARWVTATASQHRAALTALRRAQAHSPPVAQPGKAHAGLTGGMPAGARAAAPSGAPPAPAALADRLASPPRPAWLSGRPGSFASAAVRQRVLAYLADSAALVADMRQQMADGQGYAPASSGGFSLAQHLWHLADVEELGWAQRFRRLLDETRPVLPGVDGDRLAAERRYQQRPWRGAARRFEAQRKITLHALARCDNAVLTRAVRFSGQAATGAEMLSALLAHDHEHRCEMAALWPPASLPSRPAGRPRETR